MGASTPDNPQPPSPDIDPETGCHHKWRYLGHDSALHDEVYECERCKKISTD